MLQRADISDVLKAEERRARRRGLVCISLIAMVAIVVVVGVIWAWSAWRGAAIVAYTTDAAAKGDIVVVLTATGMLEPTSKVAVSSLVSGTIASIAVDYNQQVRKGQVLAQIDTQDLDTKLKRQMAMVEAQSASRDAAQAAVSDAEAALRRATELSRGEVVSIRDIELATTALQRAKASLTGADAQLDAAEADLTSAQNERSRATITAPIDGMILDLNAEVGEAASASSLASLFTIAGDLHQLDLEVEIDEADVPRVAVGDTATFTVEAMPDQPLAGVVRQVRNGPTVSNGVISYKAVIAVDNANLLLRPGMTATADISIDQAHDVLTVSNAALRFAPSAAAPAGLFGAMQPQSSIEMPAVGDQRVYVLRDGAPAPVVVTAGRSDGQRSEILSGELSVGDLVITGVKGH